MMNLGYEAKFSWIGQASTGAPISTDFQAGAVLDMSGFDSVTFVALMDVTTASSTGLGTLVYMHSNSTSTTDMVSCTGADYIAQTTSMVDKLLVLDVNKPQKRYVSAYLEQDAAANTNILAIQYNNRKGAITQDTSTYGVQDIAVAISPTT
jgi:hypothetical protein